MPGRKKIICGTLTNKGTPCQCKALGNGFCRYHGGEGVVVEDQKRAVRARGRLTRETDQWLREQGFWLDTHGRA